MSGCDAEARREEAWPRRWPIAGGCERRCKRPRGHSGAASERTDSPAARGWLLPRWEMGNCSGRCRSQFAHTCADAAHFRTKFAVCYTERRNLVRGLGFTCEQKTVEMTRAQLGRSCTKTGHSGSNKNLGTMDTIFIRICLSSRQTRGSTKSQPYQRSPRLPIRNMVGGLR